MPRPIQCPRPTNALGRWLEAYLYRRMSYRRAPSVFLLWCWRWCVVGQAIVQEGQRVVPQVDGWSWHHVRAILSMPTDVWKVNRAGQGWLHVEAWRQKVTAPTPRERADRSPWVWPSRIALAGLLLTAAWLEPVQAGVSCAALAATTIHEVQTGGSDTLNGGMFDPGQTAGMFTNGAATSATGASPVFTSASYNFVAGDVGAWVFIASGTNWTPGWYKIASVAANAATLSAAVGAAVVSMGAAGAAVSIGLQPSRVIGCATTASPTGATWSIDYSQQAAAELAYTDLASVGAGLTVSSAAQAFGAQQVGNGLVITGGTNFTTGRWVIASVAASVATLVGPANVTTGAGLNGTGGLGGAFASPAKPFATLVASNSVFVQAGSYTVTTASTNIAVGCISNTLAGVLCDGYSTVRGDLGTAPVITASGISTFTLLANSGGGGVQFANLVLDGASLTSSRGVAASGTTNSFHAIIAKNCTNSGIACTLGNGLFHKCIVTGCSTQPAFLVAGGAGFVKECEARVNTVTGFSATSGTIHCNRCIANSNSGASSDGFLPVGASSVINCTTYGNGRDGVRVSVNQVIVSCCVAESNTGIGFNFTAGSGSYFLYCAAYNNTGGNISFTGTVHLLSQVFITGTASFFTNAAAEDFSLNTAAGGGALLRAAGYPGVFPGGLTTGYIDIGAAQSRPTVTAILAGSGLGLVAH